MDSENTTSEPCVEQEVLLEYLLHQCDANAHHRLRLGFVFQCLGYCAVYHDKDALRTYQDVHLPCYTPFDRLRTYQRLFTVALTRLRHAPLRDVEYPTLPDYPRGIKRGTCKKFLVTAMRDGNEMLESNDVRFLSVFLLVSWLGLRFDRDTLADFESRCVSPDAEPQERIKTGLRILKEALSPRANKPS